MITSPFQEETYKRVDLRALQHEQLIKLLSLNKSSNFEELGGEDPYIWKILVFDNFCQESLSTIFRVGNLRDENITLHLPLNSQRDKIHGVNTIYYVQPTEGNISRIIEDFEKDLYDSVYINFVYPVEEALLQKLAKSLSRCNGFPKLKQVYQHHLNYIAPTPSLFNLDIPNVYQRLKDPKERSVLVNVMAHSIVSVLMTLRALPVLYYQAGVSEEVAKRIDAIMTEVISEFHYKNPHDQFFTKQNTLVLTNRDIDHNCLLLHPWHYGALVDDVLRIKNNKVNFPDQKAKNKNEEYDLDFKADKFWADNMNQPFPNVTAEVENELNRWNVEYETLGHKKEPNKAEDISSNLSNALNKVPEMSERMKKMEMHTNLASYLSQQIHARNLDRYFEVEKTLIFNKYLSSREKDEFFAILKEEKTDKDSILDKVRLMAIFHQTIENPNAKDIEKIEQITKSFGDKIDARIKEYLHVRRIKPHSDQPTSTSQEIDLKNPGINLLRGLASKVSQGKGLLKSMLPGAETSFTAVKLVGDIFVNRNFLNNEGIFHINMAARVDSKNFEKTNDCILFLCDGGSMNEYQNLTELADKIKGNVLYGCSYLYSAKEFLSEV